MHGVLCELRVLFANDEGFEPGAALFIYREDDPYTVCVLFRGDLASDVTTWEISRETFLEWITVRRGQPSGLGDFRIWDYTGDQVQLIGETTLRAVPLVVLEFQSFDDRTQVYVSKEDIIKFVQRTGLIVRFGTESSKLNMDKVLANLLSGSG